MSGGPWLLVTPGDRLACLLPGGRDIAGFVYLASDLPEDAARVVVTSQALFLAQADALAARDVHVTVILRAEAGADAPGRSLRLAALAGADPRFAGRLGYAALSPGLIAGMPEFQSVTVERLPLASDAMGRVDATLVEDVLHLPGAPSGAARSLPMTAATRPRLFARLRPTNAAALPDALAELAPALSASAPQPRGPVLMVVPNGVGLGHLTRLMAVARALDARGAGPVLFWSYSRAAQLIAEARFRVHARQTAEHLDAPFDDWCDWEAHDLAELIRSEGIAAIVQDGSRLGPAVLQALDLPGTQGTRLVWVRRGMWQAHADVAPLKDECLADLVLEPGDLASGADLGATRRGRPQHSGFAVRRITPPVVATARSQLLPRAQARRVLGLPKRGRVVLLNLGGTALTDHAVLRDALDRVGQGRGLTFFSAQSPFQDVAPEGPGARLYPVAPCLAAFDGIVSAAGYNSFHEALLLTRLPLLLAPVQHARLDDQMARARFAAESGWAELFDAAAPGDAAQALERFLDAVTAGRDAKRPEAQGDGAAAMAAAIAGLLGLGDSTAGRRQHG